ncbi:hypothetical protein INT45_010435, partial [Circinella minor]
QDAATNSTSRGLYSVHAAALATNAEKEAEKYPYEVQPGVFETDDLVSEVKLLRFLKEEVETTGNQKKRRGNDGGAVTLQYESYSQCLKAIIDLWKDQKAAGKNDHPHPRGDKLNTWRKAKQISEKETRRANNVDRGIGTLEDGYNFEEMVAVSLYFFDRQSETEMRNRATFLLHHMMLLRGESSRFAELADLFTMHFPEEGHSPCPVLIFHSEFGKTTTSGNRNYFATIRHRDVCVCAFGALAFYFFYRFHVSGEPFPDFSTSENWFKIKMLKGCDRFQDMAYTTQNDEIHRAFNACDITSLHTTHAGHGSGARDAELHGASEDSLRRHGGWNMQSMERHYLSKISRKPLRTINGFPAKQGHFWLPRSIIEPPSTLQRKVFPEADTWLERINNGDGCEKTIAAQGFLRLLITMRTIILQDAAMLRRSYPNHRLFQQPIFQDDEYRTFEASLVHACQTTPSPAELRLQSAIPDVSRRLDAIDTKLEMHQRVQMEAYHRENVQLREKMNMMCSQLDRFMSGHFRFVPGSSHTETINGTTSQPNAQSRPTASSTNLTSERPVYYLNRSIKTVTEVWREWSVGLTPESPAVSQLEDEFGASWRQDQAERQAFSRRLNIIKAVNDIAEQKGIPADERFRAAEMLDEAMNRRDWKSLNALINDLKGNANVLNDLSVRKTF